ncbi:hypothetical protein Y032_0011g1560 [Ancylostoma ceylanicum]|uniref:F-box domain-containing protein n=1 Tax=Ancylostoma ceylanicum TaxID=53326 RepID=A0A016VFP9_9BILA|nr:hypothetical protein Y032_0011g1560 [Ancylostoma ceylanicum]
MPENEVLLFDVQFEPFDSCAFHCWSDLPNVLKIKILQYLPYPTIRQFMFLSKECYMLASNTRTQAEIVQLREQWCLTEYLGVRCFQAVGTLCVKSSTWRLYVVAVVRLWKSQGVVLVEEYGMRPQIMLGSKT